MKVLPFTTEAEKILLTREKKLAIIYFVFAIYDTEGKEVRKDKVRV